ncbi:10334_t:CDS:2, partial [Gigaspora rosea]
HGLSVRRRPKKRQPAPKKTSRSRSPSARHRGRPKHHRDPEPIIPVDVILDTRKSWEEIAEFCGANPLAQDVCAAALQRKEMLVEHRIKPTKIDAAKTFDIEVAEWYDETHTKANNWWNVRDFI